MTTSPLVSFHGSHNSAVAFYDGNGNYGVVEFERIIGLKNAGLAQYKVVPSPEVYVKVANDIIKKHWGIKEFDVCYSTNAESLHGRKDGTWEKVYYNEFLKAKTQKWGPPHHYCHACGTFYQSNFNEAIIISFDGGGDDGYFNIFIAKSRAEGPIHVVKQPYDLGFAYMVFGDYISEIKKESCLGDGNLVYSGKLMGLCGYGKHREEWIQPMKEFYRAGPEGPTYADLIKKLGDSIGITFDTNKRLSGQISYDLAATSQKVFEDLFFEMVDPTIQENPNLPICITGGCGLNVLLNTEVKKRYNRPMFVAPNSSDCGIALGNLLSFIKPEKPVNILYAGVPLLDIDSIGHHLYDPSYNSDIYDYSHDKMVSAMMDGKIIGVARGNSEHGPRALGNRSIMCDPARPQMKDILNDKVKHREWYRPFAPVVRYEDANDYFEVLEESKYMSYAFKVRDAWKEKLSSITHVDGTARVQTLRQEDNPWLYELLTKFKEKSGHGVLLNTSFNVNGKPILSTVAEAFKVFNNTQMDGLVIENTMVTKR